MDAVTRVNTCGFCSTKSASLLWSHDIHGVCFRRKFTVESAVALLSFDERLLNGNVGRVDV